MAFTPILLPQASPPVPLPHLVIVVPAGPVTVSSREPSAGKGEASVRMQAVLPPAAGFVGERTLPGAGVGGVPVWMKPATRGAARPD